MCHKLRKDTCLDLAIWKQLWVIAALARYWTLMVCRIRGAYLYRIIAACDGTAQQSESGGCQARTGPLRAMCPCGKCAESLPSTERSVKGNEKAVTAGVRLYNYVRTVSAAMTSY